MWQAKDIQFCFNPPPPQMSGRCQHLHGNIDMALKSLNIPFLFCCRYSSTTGTGQTTRSAGNPTATYGDNRYSMQYQSPTSDASSYRPQQAAADLTSYAPAVSSGTAATSYSYSGYSYENPEAGYSIATSAQQVSVWLSMCSVQGIAMPMCGVQGHAHVRCTGDCHAHVRCVGDCYAHVRCTGDCQPMCGVQGIAMPMCGVQGIAMPMCGVQGIAMPMCGAQGIAMPMCGVQGIAMPMCGVQGIAMPMCGVQGIAMPMCGVQGIAMPMCGVQGIAMPMCGAAGRKAVVWSAGDPRTLSNH